MRLLYAIRKSITPQHFSQYLAFLPLLKIVVLQPFTIHVWLGFVLLLFLATLILPIFLNMPNVFMFSSLFIAATTIS